MSDMIPTTKLTEVIKDGCHYFLNEKGNKEGKWCQHNQVGTIIHETDYKNGQQNGLDVWYDQYRNKEVETTYKEGKLHGTKIIWFTGGIKKCEEGEYNNGNLKKATRYDYYGNITEETYYNDHDYIMTSYVNSTIRQMIKRENNKMFMVSLKDEKDRECNLQQGKIVVWKACCYEKINVYVKIEVPEEAQRLTVIEPKYDIFTYKSRISHGLVLEIVDEKGNDYNDAKSFVFKDNELTYVVGKVVTADRFDDNPLHVCSFGIHVHAHKDHCNQWFNA